jgi:hypothetical protein
MHDRHGPGETHGISAISPGGFCAGTLVLPLARCFAFHGFQEMYEKRAARDGGTPLAVHLYRGGDCVREWGVMSFGLLIRRRIPQAPSLMVSPFPISSYHPFRGSNIVFLDKTPRFHFTGGYE